MKQQPVTWDGFRIPNNRMLRFLVERVTVLNMNSNFGIHLPIVDIVQTINSASYGGGMSNLSKAIVNPSSRGIHELKREFECGRTSERQLRPFTEKCVSCIFFPKKSVLRHEEREPGAKRLASSMAKVGKFRKTSPQIPGKLLYCNCTRDGECLGDKKSLKVLFKARKIYGADEEDHGVSLFRGPVAPSPSLKRKATFADYVRMKRRKRNGS